MPGRPRRRTAAAGDDGFTLIEVVVAMSLFAVAASLTLGLVVQTTGVVRNNIRRTTAAGIGQSAIEAVRTTAATVIPDGTSTSYSTVGNVQYTVTQTAKFVSSSSSASICDGGGTSLAYKLVTVKVSWPNMGSVNPIRLDTLKAVTIGTKTGDLDSTLGSLAIFVSSANGGAVANVPVTITAGGVPQTKTSSDDGCVVFPAITAGTYTASASQSGYAGIANTQASSIGSLGVTAGQLTRGTLYYDAVANLDVGFDSPATAVVPAGLPLRVGGTYKSEYTLGLCSGPVTAACTTAVPGSVKYLFPDNWTVKAGSCIETSASSATIDLRTAATTPTPSIVLPVAAVTVKVSKLLGGVATARTVTLTHAAAAGCTSGETYTFTYTGTAAGTQVVLPYGTWTVATTSVGTGVGTVLSSPVVVSGANKTPTVSLVVVA
jgi:prepilin-type N-terminal cleavage/methylation domain-containing protein